jgi:hypothetical protein
MSEHAIAASFHAVLQSKEQQRKPLTYSGTRPISIPVERAIAIWLGSTGNEPEVQQKAAAFNRWHEPDDARVSSPDL